MSETSETKLTNSANPEELAEVIAEFEQYRERLLNETLTIAKKAKVSKKAAMAQLEPELNQIDHLLQQLRDQQATLTANN